MLKDQLSDSELWNAIVMDDSGAFSALFDRYWSKLYTTAYKYLKDEALSEEIVHDIFLSIWSNRKHLNIASFQNYLISSTRYQVYKAQKKNKRSPLQLTEEYSEDNALSCNNYGAERLDSIELQHEIDARLKQLPKRCQEIFALSRYDNLSNDEIAERLNISKRSVENQITNALKFLRVVMKDIAVVILIERLMR
jgi:RNA polymerase sigma-70 factor (family 1)